jgi:hypothetical protein
LPHPPEQPLAGELVRRATATTPSIARIAIRFAVVQPLAGELVRRATAMTPSIARFALDRSHRYPRRGQPEWTIE